MTFCRGRDHALEQPGYSIVSIPCEFLTGAYQDDSVHNVKPCLPGLRINISGHNL